MNRLGLAVVLACAAGCGPADPVLDGGRADGALVDAQPSDRPEPLRCAGGCPQCQECRSGECVAVGDMRACAAGRCRAGVCCAGCWDGTACSDGNEVTACGAAGLDCEVCPCPGDRCDVGLCVSGSRAVDVDAGDDHTCVVLEDGSVICFGRNLSGAVGDDSEASFVPVPAHVATGAIATAAGGDFSLAVTDAKGLLAWGGNDDGQLGLGDLGDGTERRAPILTPIDDWRAVAAGGAHACGIATTGQLRCWGSSELGQTGLGTTVPTPAPTAVGTAEWSDVSAGNAHSCGVQTGATLWCWGSNARSQLGLGRGGITQTRGEPTSVSAAAGWTQVAAGSDHTCALQAPGVLWCWGDNGAGQLGTGDTATRTLPWFIEGTVWREVTAGGRHSCGVFGDGLILCWGDNASGQLGTGDRMPAPRPARVSGRGGPWTTVSAGRAHTCAVDEAGAVYCWGAGADGRLGLGDEDDRVAPTRVCLGLE